SELCGTPSRRAAQGSLSEAKAATVGDAAGHRLTRPAHILERAKQTYANDSNGPKSDARSPVPDRVRDHQNEARPSSCASSA
ncbi:MAG: hypothetical protein Q7U73_02670, partial [Rubrivivax sp.]|nr:hypothetical protein [Rubrivivax sp.]